MNHRPFMLIGSYSNERKARAAAKLMPFSVKRVHLARGKWALQRVS